MAWLQMLSTAPVEVVYVLVDFLSMADFERLRAVTTGANALVATSERRILRRHMQTLRDMGEISRLILQDLLEEHHWNHIMNVAGWLEHGAIGAGLRNLRHRLTGLLSIWEAALATKPSTSEEGSRQAERLP